MGSPLVGVVLLMGSGLIKKLVLNGAAGWVVYGAWEEERVEAEDLPVHMARYTGSYEQIHSQLVFPRWTLLWTAGSYLGQASIVSAELAGIEAAISAVEQAMHR